MSKLFWKQLEKYDFRSVCFPFSSSFGLHKTCLENFLCSVKQVKSDLKCIWLAFNVPAATEASSCLSLSFYRIFSSLKCDKFEYSYMSKWKQNEALGSNLGFPLYWSVNLEQITSSRPSLPWLWNQDSNIHHKWWMWRLKKDDIYEILLHCWTHPNSLHTYSLCSYLLIYLYLCPPALELGSRFLF